MADKIIAVDFDGTIVAHAYPAIGRENPNAFRVLKLLQEQGVKLILWTMRSGPSLTEAFQYCKDNGIEFWGYNENPDQKEWTGSPKAFAQIYIDDAALGCPLIWDQSTNRHMVNWRDIENLLKRKGLLI